MKLYDYCIWDFNGTILDDVELGISSANELLRKHGIPVISGKEEYRRKFNFPIIDYYKALGFDFERTPYEELAEDWIAIYMRDLDSAKAFDDVADTLDFFDERGIKQTVLSASERGMLVGQLEDLGISDRFEDILGIDNIYADSKLALARAWRSAHPDAKAMFIGDTLHDCETAKLLGADCFIVCAGHQSRERFDGLGAQIFDSLTELTEYLKGLM